MDLQKQPSDFKPASPVGEWEMCGDRFYSKHDLYEMQWGPSINLAQNLVAASQYGGPLAIVRDDSKIVLLTPGHTMHTVVRIYTAAGRQMGAFVWERGRIAAMGWSSEEELMVVERDGSVTMYSPFGELLPRQFSLGSACREQGVSAAQVFSAGVVALTARNELWAVTGLEDPRPQKLADPGLFEPPHCMAVIEPHHTLSGCVEVVVAAGSTLKVVDADSCQDQGFAFGPVLRMAVSPNGQFLAVFTEDGRLMVLSSDFSRNLSEFNTKSDVPPEQIAWCGADAVLLYWEEVLLMVGPFGDWVYYPVEEAAVLVPEIDGVRIVTNRSAQLLRRVADSLVDIFQIGSTSPGAALVDARTLFDRMDAKADQYLRQIPDLSEAISTCCSAASAEINVARQKLLLKAACYGKAFCPDFPSGAIYDVVRTLRVLNCLWMPEHGLPITAEQLSALSMPVLVARLTASRRHLLALRVSQFVGLPEEPVLTHWACARIAAASQVPDVDLAKQLLEKLRPCPDIRYAAIAAHAQSHGRKQLAVTLLNHEPRASQQVPLLLSLGEEEQALDKAIASGDTDMAYLVLFHMYREPSRQLQDFLSVIRTRPAAMSLFTAYCRRTEPELMKTVYLSHGINDGVAAMMFEDAVRVRALHMGHSGRPGTSSSASGAGGHLHVPGLTGDGGPIDVVRTLEKASGEYGSSKEYAFQQKATDEFARLCRLQAHLEKETGQSLFAGLSVAETLQVAVSLGNSKAVAQLRSEFKVPDKHFWWIKLRTLSRAKDWDALEAFARERKVPPIGIEPFIHACRAHEAPQHVVAGMIARVPDMKARAEHFAEAGLIQEAAEAAAAAKDADMLTKLKGMVGQSSTIGVAIDQLRDRLNISRQ
uniref:Protein VACUOLELESS1 n=1 Tax=Tetraselmis sp. GSL018 TaxID=582737 RepID=A0A061RIB2_9CHLO|mmetsp:Transcript_21448/g.51152  ORF Transcript_21448/g.51152 Transcript_21448/m.51152 type:complete len:875 (-) Transcript_21448:461-3085(-)